MRASTHWLHQRISAAALCFFLPCIWWFFSTISRYSYNDLRSLISEPIVILPLTLFFFFTLYHTRLGLQVILEDYTKNRKKKQLILSVDIILSVLFLIFLYSAIRLIKGAI